jgi:hypothetical protein
MPDGFIYNCTDIGIEGEWFYLSKGEYGITTDDTEWDYNKYLNAWDKLIRFNSL